MPAEPHLRAAAAADALLEAHRLGRPTARFEPPATVGEAYRVQREVLDRLSFGARPVAWKVSPAAPGREMLASPVASRLERSPATIAAGTRAILGLEAEVAFRFASTPPPDPTLADVRAAVDEMFVLIELCETRLADWSGAAPLAKLADFQSHGAFVVGSGTRELSRDFATQRFELDVGGRSGVGGVGTHPSGRLWEMLAWTVQHCAARGLALQAGDVVTTGSWNGLTPVARGEEAVARFAGIGEARLTLS